MYIQMYMTVFCVCLLMCLECVRFSAVVYKARSFGAHQPNNNNNYSKTVVMAMAERAQVPKRRNQA